MSNFANTYILTDKKSRNTTHYFNPTSSPMYVPESSIVDFWINYCEAISEGTNTFISEYIDNLNDVQLGFSIDLRFNRQQIPPKQDVIDDLKIKINEYVEYIIANIQMMIKVFFQNDERGYEILACYLLPENPENMEGPILNEEPSNFLIWKEDKLEFKSRIIFPYARIEKKYIKRFYESVLNHLQVSANNNPSIANSLDGIGNIFRPLSTQMIDMYGSSTDVDHLPFFIYRCYGALDGSTTKMTMDTNSVFVPVLHKSVAPGCISKEIIDQYSNERDEGDLFWLPLLFSGGYFSKCMEIKPHIHLVDPDSQEPKIKLNQEENFKIKENDEVTTLMNFISHNRSDDEGSWLDVGQALHSINKINKINKNNDLLKLWKWFTQQGSLKTEEDCDFHWYNFDNFHRVTIETLDYFASQDSPEEYKKYREQEIRSTINIALYEPEETNVAMAFKKCFPHDFICRNFEKSQWCYFANHHWSPMNGSSRLIEYMIGPFKQKLEELRAEVTNNIAKSRDIEYKSQQERLVELFTNLIRKINTTSFKDRLCRELKTPYHGEMGERFDSLKNTNQFLFAVQNGVLDFRSGKGILRPGKPQDYITRTSNIEYSDDFSWNHPKVMETMKYIGQVFRSKSVKEYVLELISSLMISGNQNKIFPIFTGYTNNSKSKFVELISYTFGRHSGTIPTSFLTDKPTGADQASPALVASLGAKVVFLQEPDSTKDRIRSGNVKYITGNDKIWFRDLFQKGEEARKNVV